MIPGRQIGRSRAMARAVAKNAGIPPKVFDKLWDEYELTKREAEKIAIEIEDNSKAQSRLNELKRSIKSLGTVNVSAIEEYKEVSERYTFMSEQVEDVEKSKKEL